MPDISISFRRPAPSVTYLSTLLILYVGALFILITCSFQLDNVLTSEPVTTHYCFILLFIFFLSKCCNQIDFKVLVLLSLGYTHAKIIKNVNYICCSLWDYTNVVMNFLCDPNPLGGSRSSSFDWLQYFDVVITGRSFFIPILL